MAIIVDGAGKLITIEQSSCTLVSGTLYKINTETMRAALKAWEASAEGIVWEDTHTSTAAFTVAGVTYARSFVMANSYQVVFTPDTLWSVRLEGSNNDIWDIEAGNLVQNSVQVIPTNSAGLQVVTTGSAVTDQDKTDIVNQMYNQMVDHDNAENQLSMLETQRLLLAVLTGEILVPAVGESGYCEILSPRGNMMRVRIAVDGEGNRTEPAVFNTTAD